jgi:hypothetical protein
VGAGHESNRNSDNEIAFCALKHVLKYAFTATICSSNRGKTNENNKKVFDQGLR